MTKTIEQKALKFIDENQLIEKGDKVLVALSGGADSVFLLAFLLKFKNRFKIDIAAFHLNHNLRGKTAVEDENFCIEFSSKINIKLVCISKDVKAYAKKMKVSVEEAGRDIRYTELNKAATKMKCTRIATAHNSSDNVETILLNFIKGTGLKGLVGIPVRRDNIIRPILCLSAEEIRTYLKANKIPFRVDESNLDSDYERNFLRNEIIPKLKKRLNPKLEEKISNTSKIISELNSYIDKQIEKVRKEVIKSDKQELRISLQKITALDQSLLSILIKTVIENKFKIELSSENIFSLLDLIFSQTGKSVHLKENIIAAKERNELVIRRSSASRIEKSIYKIKVGQKIGVGGKTITVAELKRKMIKFSSDKSIEYISGDGLGKIFEIRKWKSGDKFQPIGMNGTKKVSDFLSDEKASSMNKKDFLVLTYAGKIVWVIGLRIDDRFKVTSKTKKIFKLSITEI
ncbi:MAG: tRNA lysidine(34) synthetase TilS [Ignavibacteriales bacterium]